MSWLNKTAAVLLPLMLAACGFQPMYGRQDGAEKTALQAGVRIDPIAGIASTEGDKNVERRLGQMFRIGLEEKLNPGGVIPPNPKYRLATTLGHSQAAIGVARDGTISRYNVYLASTYRLYRIADDKLIASGALQHVVGYNNITNQYFSSYVGEEDALKRGLGEMSELYRQRLGAYLTVHPEGTAAAAAGKPGAGETLPVFLPGSDSNIPVLAPGASGLYPVGDSPYENRLP